MFQSHSHIVRDLFKRSVTKDQDDCIRANDVCWPAIHIAFVVVASSLQLETGAGVSFVRSFVWSVLMLNTINQIAKNPRANLLMALIEWHIRKWSVSLLHFGGRGK